MHRNIVILLLIISVIIVIASAKREGHPRRFRQGLRKGARGAHWRRNPRHQRDFRQRKQPPYWTRWLDSKSREAELARIFASIQKNGRFDFHDIFGHGFGWNTRDVEKPWWEGPNVCTNRKETIENTTIADSGPISRHYSVRSQICDETETSYKCTSETGVFMKKKKVVEIFECCHGYTRKEGMFGCPTEFILEDITKTAQKLGLNEFLRAVQSVELTKELETGNFTVFAPVDKAFKEGEDFLPEYSLKLAQDMPPNVVMVSKPITSLVLNDMSNILLGHLIYDTLKTSNMNDEQLLETASPYSSELRINFYSQPEKLITVNCARVLSADNQATNGIIHTVDRILEPVTETIVDYISKNPKMSVMKTAIARAELVRTLRGDGQFTLFAPTDDAFAKMDQSLKDRLLGDKTCLEKVLHNHLLPSVICSTVIQGRANSPNMLKNYLNLTRTDDDKLFVDGSQIVVKDIVATNGVIHIIEDVLIPDEALGLLDLAEKNELTDFIEFVNQSGLLKDLKKMENLTVFIPSNDAFEKLPSDVVDSLIKDPELLREVLMYHVVPEVVSCNKLHNNYHLDTLVKDEQIRINGYSSFPFGHHSFQTAQCAKIVKTNIPACNGVINVVDKVLMPPSGNVLDIISSKKEFSTLLTLLKKSGLAELLQEDGPFTLFAPTDAAFKKLNRRVLKDLENDKESLLAVLKNHIVKEFVCCASLTHFSSWLYVPKVYAVSGARIPVREIGDQLKYSDALVEECDVTATNGVVHAIDQVIISSSRRQRPFWEDFYRWY